MKTAFLIAKVAKKTNLNITITDEDKERLRQLAEIEERTMSQLAARFIREGLDRSKVGSASSSKEDAA